MFREGSKRLYNNISDNNKNELVDLQHETANVWEEVTKFVRKIYRKHNVKPTIQFV